MKAQNYKNSFLYYFMLNKEKMLTDRAILKVEIEDGRKAP